MPQTKNVIVIQDLSQLMYCPAFWGCWKKPPTMTVTLTQPAPIRHVKLLFLGIFLAGVFYNKTSLNFLLVSLLIRYHFFYLSFLEKHSLPR